ncbi:hypothetical protein BGX33_012498 [Mortierella sp. NVP41]|nr:hypothetical protein BGX33_012498 [Mortierella sp. NVP41]
MSDTGATTTLGDTTTTTTDAGSGTGTGTTPTDTTPQSPPTKSDQHPHHVIFVVHGMGRQLEEFGNYERNVSYLVENTKTVLQSQFHELETDVHIIPIEWHAKLHSMVDDRMALASLRTVPKVRMVMNDYMSDILYYFNPHFGKEIVQMIVEELNEAYATFVAKHPDFNGKISVYAHSLGGVAMFDILTCIDDDDPEETQSTATATTSPVEEVQQDGATSAAEENVQEPVVKKVRVRKQDQPKFKNIIPKLNFRPDYLFTIGSPVGAVLVMRNLDWETFHPPDDIIHHNIFHPFDPLGYRVEPLIDSVFAGIPATFVSSYSQSQLFPSLSLPSLPSLLPESISTFWENRVPTLPRPSIPTLSSISLMTQSLKAGRWLPGNNARAEDEGSSSTLDSDDDDQEGTRVATEGEGEGEGEVASPATSVSGSEESTDAESQGDRATQSATRNWEREPMVIGGGDASVSECMAAATAGIYLDKTENASNSGSSVARPSDAAAIKAQNDTTTESPQQGRQPPTKRPSLGPRRISSRVEDECEASKQNSGAARTMLNVAEETEGRLEPLNMEYYLGMEEGATAEEKAMGLGAKSDVIQESIVRSMPDEPASNKDSSNNNNIEGADDTCRTDNKSDAEETTTNTARKTVHVEGRATKVPYRIDHVLQETTVDMYTNEYLLGMRSHFRYWGNRDIAYHILKTMLEPIDPEVEDTVLDLKLSMPPPVSTTKGAKEAAEAKAKATARARSGTMSSTASTTTDATETKKQNRMSFSFSFFGVQSNSSSDDLSSLQGQQGQQGGQEERERRRQRQEEADEDLAMMGEEGELFGYRYSDLDMSSKANVGWTTSSSGSSLSTTKTLFQSSPWSKRVVETEVVQSSSSSTYSRVSKRISVERKETSTSASTSSLSRPGGAGGEEEVPMSMDIPDLARPAKLHHRAARVEE